MMHFPRVCIEPRATSTDTSTARSHAAADMLMVPVTASGVGHSLSDRTATAGPDTVCQIAAVFEINFRPFYNMKTKKRSPFYTPILHTKGGRAIGRSQERHIQDRARRQPSALRGVGGHIKNAYRQARRNGVLRVCAMYSFCLQRV
jgi:hypothetical protein